MHRPSRRRRGRPHRSPVRAILSFEVVFGLTVIAAFAAAAAISLLFASDAAHPAPRAIIVDQLGLTDPNDAFSNNARALLEEAGYEVDAVPPSGVTVALYKALPRLGYDLIILRSHAAAFSTNPSDSAPSQAMGVALFTNELYDTTSYVADQRAGLLSRARYEYDFEDRAFFAVDARSVRDWMEGSFDGATIVLMGCAGLRTDNLAAAFYARGAARFVSWDDDVSAPHTDRATLRFLEHLTDNNARGLDAALALTMQEVGPDPLFGARLLAYPLP